MVTEGEWPSAVSASCPDPFVTVNADGIISDWNLAAEPLFGWSKAEVIGRRLCEVLIPQGNWENFEDRFRRSAAGGDTPPPARRFEHIALHRDGHPIAVEVTAWKVAAAECTSYSALLRDVSATRAVAEALRASEERLQLLIDGTPDYAIFMLDPNGLILTWNRGAECLKGYTAAEVTGSSFSMFYTAEQRADGQPQKCLAQAVAKGQYEEEGWRVRQDGSRFWAHVSTTALYSHDGSLRGFSKVTRDDTERQAAAEALQVSEERFRRAFLDAPIGVCLVDLEGHFQQVNQALADLTGYSQEKLLTMNFINLSHPDDVDTDSDVFSSLLRGERKDLSREKRYVTADGKEVWVAAHIVPVRDADDKVVAVLGHAQDITERRRYEAQLVELANHDSLTGLGNRSLFGRELQSHLERCRRYGTTGAVLMLDLDNLKGINDSFGHNAGDQVIISMAEALRTRLRSADVVARLGGDEFAVLLPEAGRLEAELVAKAILQEVRDEVVVLDGDQSRHLTTSVGIAIIEDTQDTALGVPEVLAAADLAMYEAKKAGRDQYSLYVAEDHIAAVDRLR